MVSRRSFLAGGAATATLAMAPRAVAQWQPSHRLFMVASTSVYSLYVNTQGAIGG
jgi:hypothetical protein